MNIETANRLFNLRKKQGLSQEELAEKLGVSRQAVSKWERSEASPDTDNLIALAKIYGLTLDELIYGTEEARDDDADNKDDNGSENEKGNTRSILTVKSKDGDKITIDIDDDEMNVKHLNTDEGSSGIHINSGDSDLDNELQNELKRSIKNAILGGRGITVESKNGDTVNINLKNGIQIKEVGDACDEDDDDEYYYVEKKSGGVAKTLIFNIPYAILCCIAYLLFGCYNVCGGWGYSWIIFLTIPIWYSLIEAVHRRRFCEFAYPIFATFVFLYVGLYHDVWHPTWVIFITIAAYYPIAEALDNMISTHRKNKGPNE